MRTLVLDIRDTARPAAYRPGLRRILAPDSLFAHRLPSSSDRSRV
ncbi:MAG: hypothetical protein QM757_17210 [Paludibaculum sp.]